MTSIPQPRSGGRLRRPPLAIIIAAVLIVAVLATLAIRAFTSGRVDPLAGSTLAPVSRGSLVLGVSATGQVEPRTQADLAFASGSGRVSQVFVAEGDTVASGATLVELDSRELAAQVAAADANLAIARADLASLQTGATSEQIAESQAQVRAAQGSLSQIRGSVTEADLRAARAAVEEARARVAKLEAGPKNDERTRATAALEEARANQDRQRSQLAAAKANAQAAVDQQANALRNAQSAYSTAYWDLEHVKADKTDPRTGKSLNDAEVQDFVSAFEQAQRNLADVEAALKQAQVDYETARQNEISGLSTAEAQVATAQADLDSLLQGAEADEMAGARAQLARAEADLARLTGAERNGSLTAQQANLEAAQARLAQLTADPTTSDLARAEAKVAQAQAQLDQARIRLDDATLRAPFAGVVAAVSVAPGEAVGAQTVPVTLIDTGRYLVKVTVDEVDIARVAVGQPVDVLIDALGSPSLPGTVRRIEPLPKGESAVTAYQVTLEVDPSGRALKSGMTASATIVADRRDNVLSVPAAAVHTNAAISQVTVAVTGSDGRVTLEDRQVTVGLSNGEAVEILSGLAEGEQVVIR